MKSIILLGLLILGCAAKDSWLVINQRPIDPPPSYALAYSEVEDCLGQEGAFDSVRWHLALAMIHRERVCTSPTGLEVGCHAIALTYLPHHIIIQEDWADSISIIKHESIHHVLQTRDHDERTFLLCARQKLE